MTNEEEAIIKYILNNIIRLGILFTNLDFKNLIMDAFNEKFLTEDDYSKIPNLMLRMVLLQIFKIIIILFQDDIIQLDDL